MAEDDAPEPFDSPFRDTPTDESTPSPKPTTEPTAPPDYGKPDTVEERGALAQPPDYGKPPKPPTPAPTPVTIGSTPSTPAHVERAEPAQPQRTSLTQDDVLLEMRRLQEQQTKDHAEYVKEMAPLYRQVLESLKQPPPPVPQAPQTPPPPSLQQQQAQLKKSAIGYFAVALPLAILMGSRGGWAAAGAWGGFGKGLSALVEGNQQASDNAFRNWQAIDRGVQQRFENQQAVYKDVLANRAMTTQQMMDTVEFASKIFGDKQVNDQAQMSNWSGVLAALEKRDEAKLKYDQFMVNSKIKIETMKRIGLGSMAKEWEEIIRQKAIKTLGHTMDPDHPRSQEEQDVINSYPLDKFWNDKTQNGKINPRTGQPYDSSFGGGDEEHDEDLQHSLGNIFSDEPAPQ